MDKKNTKVKVQQGRRGKKDLNALKYKTEHFS